LPKGTITHVLMIHNSCS